MILEAVKYTRLQGKPKEWKIEGCDHGMVYFGNINLMVGKNASGKSRTLNAIRQIAGLFSGSLHIVDLIYSDAEYQLSFKEGKDICQYFLKYQDNEIVEENLSVNGEKKFSRSENLIYSEITGQMETYVISKHLLTVSLHNPKNYPFLEKLYQWGVTLKIAEFTNQFEKNYLLDDLSQLEKTFEPTLKRPVSLLHSFWTARHLFGDKFVDNIREDMKLLEYPIEKVDILQGASGYGLYVKENELEEVTSQLEMSQGMFRTLSFVILLNFALLSKFSVCILIDDLGEGLDFDRSRLLIGLLVKKVEGSNLQIFMSTNDRYVMNKIPLQYWSVIERYPNKSVFYNYYNSRKTFEDFKYTGFNNFDFLATDFYLKGFEG